MNRELVITELRRSAIEDQRPWIGCTQIAWTAACDLLTPREAFADTTNDDAAMFFLIVAAFLEQSP